MNIVFEIAIIEAAVGTSLSTAKKTTKNPQKDAVLGFLWKTPGPGVVRTRLCCSRCVGAIDFEKKNAKHRSHKRSRGSLHKIVDAWSGHDESDQSRRITNYYYY